MQPIIIRPGDDAGPVGILDQAQRKACGGIEHGGIDLRSFDEFDPVIRPRAVNFFQAADEPARPAVEGGKDGKYTGAFVTFVGAFEVLFQLRVGFQNMAVGIDHRYAVHHFNPPQRKQQALLAY